MAQNWTKGEIESADLVLTVDKDGRAKWSANRSSAEVAKVLRDLADEIDGPE